ncbi:MAG TPA: CPBP family intramembrane metalloprotease [Flavilitoribacter sp.]|nr:CPBP family intramembrane metalloprotease [Flavilitoribacter sp.]
MTNELIDSVLQVLAFSLIPFLVYLIAKKKVKGFFDYIGLKKSTARANVFAVLNTLVFLAPTLTLAFFNEAFKQILTDPGTITGQFRAMGFSIPTLIMILIVALAKTSLSEEIFFRGFVAKRLINWLGFSAGNILQAVIFGAIHLLLFVSVTSNPLFLAFIFGFPALGAWISAYLNEKLAGGSIIPGWISHGLANTISYCVVGFLI